MPSSSKKGREKHRPISDRIVTVHQRLNNALNLGFRCSHGGGGQKWHCSDIEAQRLVISTIDAFLGCISRDTLELPIVKDSNAGIIEALKGILLCENESTLKMALSVALKLINVLPSSTLQLYVLDLVHPLSSLLSSIQSEVVFCCATALDLILSNLSSKRERDVWDILLETKAIDKIIYNIRNFDGEKKSIEYFQVMISLLCKILWRWPPSRFSVWRDAQLMKVVHCSGHKSDFTIKMTIMQFYSSIALCGHGAMKMLENGKTILNMTVDCMGNSNPLSLQIAAFKLAQCLVISEQSCLKVLQLCCEPLVKAIIGVMRKQISDSAKFSKDEVDLLVEACRLATITRWPGKHHNYFWKLEVDRVLTSLINIAHQSQQLLSSKERTVSAKEGLRAIARPYLWDIVGWLATHYEEDMKPKVKGNELHLDNLIMQACLEFLDSIHITHQICQVHAVDVSAIEPVSRAVLMMIYSPCKYISSQARRILFEVMKQNGVEDLSHILRALNEKSPGCKYSMLDNSQLVLYLMNLACYSGLPQYQMHILEGRGIKILLSFLCWWLSNPVHIKRLSVAPHLQSTSLEKMCCHNFFDWEGEDMLLLFVLWGLAELIHHVGSVDNLEDEFLDQLDRSEVQLVGELQKICLDSYAPGPRWYAAYILSYFGLYGFPSRLGARLGKSLGEEETKDFKIVLANQQHLNVDGIILMVRCPTLLARGLLPDTGKTSSDYSGQQEVKTHESQQMEVRLSAHVDSQALMKLLEFSYFGYLQTETDLKKLKILSKHCDLQPLLQMLRRKSPKWGTPFPSYNLALALGPAGYTFSDIVLEANAAELAEWKCRMCSKLIPHMHVHKVILCASCNHFQAMFHSGMLESQSPTVKVPVSWEALTKLIDWFYSGGLPRPLSGCLWHNLDADAKLRELRPYVELCWLTNFWLLQDVHEDCMEVVISLLDSARELSTYMIKLASSFCLQKLAEVAAFYMAPSYPRLRDSGELDTLDEAQVEMVRAAFVQLSQKA